MVYPRKAPFDSSRPLVAATRKLICGVWYNRGDPIKPGAVPPRVLRQLYDHHQIGYPEDLRLRDVDTVAPSEKRRLKREAGEADPGPAKPKGPAERPITNPHRLARARGRGEAGGGAAGDASPPAEQHSPAPDPTPGGAPLEQVPEQNPVDPAPPGAQVQAVPDQNPVEPKAERASDPVAELVKGNSRDDLIDKAKKLDGFVASMNKTQLARLIAGVGDGASGR